MYGISQGIYISLGIWITIEICLLALLMNVNNSRLIIITITNNNNMEGIEITQELRKEIKQQINIAEKGNGYGDGFEYVPFFGKFLIKYDVSKNESAEKEFDFILDALKFYNSTKGSKAFWYRSELIDCQ
jgi:hypothetical protein